MLQRVYVEKKSGFDGLNLLRELRESLGIVTLQRVRILQRYDVEGLDQTQFAQACRTIFSEPQVDYYFLDRPQSYRETAFAVEYLPGQFDQRADSAKQCLALLTQSPHCAVAHATVYLLEGALCRHELKAVKDYCINPVDSREASLPRPQSLHKALPEPAEVEILTGFRTQTREALCAYLSKAGLAMSLEDLLFVQAHFCSEERDPTITELRMLDTYWSDHCRHTTFLTQITSVDFAPDVPESLREAYLGYQEARRFVYGTPTQRPETLMDIACIAMKELKKSGELDNLEISEEINAASIVVPIEVDGQSEEYLVMFKNETHNHPTEIEPFGGAATCLGGAIRDPLSGRSYVYQAMRVSGAADPTQAHDQTLEGKLPQKKICVGAAEGYSSYGNQIGLATGCVAEVYHPNYVAKRMEIGAVVAAAPKKNVFRGHPENGDVILLIGGRTGRDGVGGATGSSKEHTETALQNSAEVQKGNPPIERAIQRLFRCEQLAPKIKVCNDFGAGGVCVAIGELAPSLEINLDAVRKKYEGLDGTELAISESQERMAVVVSPEEVDYFISAAQGENLECYPVAVVTQTGRLVMRWRGKIIVNLRRDFLDTNGVAQQSQIYVEAPDPSTSPLGRPALSPASSLEESFIEMASHLSFTSQKGLIERFDGTIGAGSVLHPLGGRHQLTPPDAMVALIPTLKGTTEHCTYMSWGFNPRLAAWSPYHGAVYAVTQSICKILSTGGALPEIRLTLQEYFEKLGNDPARWGKPFAALLGALQVQRALRLAAIGGKDSMSGTFKEIHVPPSLVSFAVAPGRATHALSPEFKQSGREVMLIQTKRTADGLPDFVHLKAVATHLHQALTEGRFAAVHCLGEGGIAEGLMKMTLGNHLGVSLSHPDYQDANALFQERYACFLVETTRELPAELGAVPIGTTSAQPVLKTLHSSTPLAQLRTAYLSTLQSVYPTRPRTTTSSSPIPKVHGAPRPVLPKRASKLATPRVLIPVFPGTNCEYDTARVFEQAGASVETLLFRTLTQGTIDESLNALERHIEAAQILMLPGGFSAGDEPDGSGKFIATVLRHAKIAEAVHRLLYDRGGLILGICNGFQALLKTGLLPYGEIQPMRSGDPTLTHNTLGRHVARYAQTRVSSLQSPWLANCEIGEEHSIAFSHGEGRFFADQETLEGLAKRGQIVTQYVDDQGKASMDIEFNPNGSIGAVEGLCSPDGRVLGKMGHTERRGPLLAKNIPGNKHQPLFRAGVEYFRA